MTLGNYSMIAIGMVTSQIVKVLFKKGLAAVITSQDGPYFQRTFLPVTIAHTLLLNRTDRSKYCPDKAENFARYIDRRFSRQNSIIWIYFEFTSRK